MTGDKSIQRAGRSANQTLIQTQIVHNGISEQRAAEIAEAHADRAIRAAFEREAAIIAHGRISRADQKIIAKLTANELLDAFGEPAFLAAFQRAQIGAAQTDDDQSYEMLANLLVERARSTSSPAKSATLKAIECVDLVDSDALHNLTYLWTILAGSTCGDPKRGLENLEEVYRSVRISKNLVGGDFWIDHLESLNLVVVESRAKFKKLPEIVAFNHPGWLCVGYTKQEMDEAVAEVGRITGLHLPSEMIGAHPYKFGYFRFQATSAEDVYDRVVQLWAPETSELDDKRWYLRRCFSRMAYDKGLLRVFENEFSSPGTHLERALEWISGREPHLRITHPGKALAYTNAMRFHSLNGVIGLAQSLRRD
ncbi:LPO_1073/Vpar_1526 family protein [Nocardia beijingensis]|uniref:LPO_1073/Vpar_1526 family protein n=1 Tax=Nocardia beijingensis TaxID=95162 RepID=UPI003331FBCB